MSTLVWYESSIYSFQESIGSVARQHKQNKKASLREKYRVAQALLERLKRVLEDVSII